MSKNIVEVLLEDFRKSDLEEIVKSISTVVFIIEDELKFSNLKTLKYVLNNINPESYDSFHYLFVSASENGCFRLVKYLLDHDIVEPDYEQETAFVEAVFSGHLEVVQLLLTDERIDPCIFDNYVFKRIYKENPKSDMVKLLWQNKNIQNDLFSNDRSIFNDIKKQNIKEMLVEF